MQLAQYTQRAGKLIADNSPLVLTSVAVAGSVSTTLLAVRAGFRAGARLGEEPPFIERKEAVQLVWKEFIPPAVTGVITIVAIVGANRISNRRAAAVATAYALSEQAFAEYKDKVKEKLTGPKLAAIQDELAQDKVGRTEGSSLVLIGDGKVLCFDTYTARYFESSMEELKKAMNDINYRINGHGYASLGDFYTMIGLAATAMGDEVGWNTKLLELEFSTTLSEDGRPCLAISFMVEPVRNYYKFG